MKYYQKIVSVNNIILSINPKRLTDGICDFFLLLNATYLVNALPFLAEQPFI